MMKIYWKFTNESANKSIVKIGKHLAKLWTKVLSHIFCFTVYMKAGD